MKSEKRIANFITLLAEQLYTQFSIQELEEALLSSATTLEKLLKSSIENLPQSSLKQTLVHHDCLPQLLQLLRQRLQALRSAEPQNLSLQSKEDRSKTLKEAVDDFLKDFRDGNLETRKSRQIFGRLLQVNDEPSLELLWSFAAAQLMESRSPTAKPFQGADSRVSVSETLRGGGNAETLAEDVGSRISVAKTLFQCFTACTVGKSCSGSTSISALVPVIVILSEAVKEFSEHSNGRLLNKSEKKTLKNLKNLVAEVVSYVAICGRKNRGFFPLNLPRSLSCCIALLGFLNVRRTGKGSESSFERDMEEFFPLTSPSIQAALLDEDCSVEYLASVVILEATLLRLVVEVIDRRGALKHQEACASVAKDGELRQNLRILAVNCIATAKNQSFFDILLELLLEKCLPIASFLSPDEEIFLRGVLYEATTLVNYAYLRQHGENQTNEANSGDKINKIFLNRMVVAHQAVQLFRSLGDRSCAVSFSKSFSNIPVPSELMKWLNRQERQPKQPQALSQNPQALIGQLVNLEDQQKLKLIVNKHSVFNPNSLPSEKAESNGRSNEATLGMSSSIKSSAEIEEDLFFVDKKGESDVVKGDEKQSVGKSFILAAHSMVGTGNDRKRKSKKQKILFQRHIQLDDPANKKTLVESGSDLSGSEASDLELEGFSNKPKKSRIETEILAVD